MISDPLRKHPLQTNSALSQLHHFSYFYLEYGTSKNSKKG